MTPDQLKTTVIDALAGIAPELNPSSIESGTNLRDQLDLDSMDFLNFVRALHDRVGVEIPEADYPRLSTLDGAVTYLAAKTRTGTSRRRDLDSDAPR